MTKMVIISCLGSINFKYIIIIISNMRSLVSLSALPTPNHSYIRCNIDNIF